MNVNLKNKTITINDWIKYFPLKTPRKEQEIAINFILESFVKNKKFVVGEFPLGIGKSAIAVTVSNYLYGKYRDNAYIVTTQKILQEQYIKDFPYIASITAKNNYQCVNRIAGVTCDMGLVMSRVLSKNNNQIAAYNDTCVYKKSKKNFDESTIGLTNLSYFLSHADVDIKQRNLLVVDECHNIENIITEFAALNFSKHFIVDTLKIQWPIKYNTTIEDLVKWIKEIYVVKLTDAFIGLDSKINSMASTSYLESNSGINVMKKLEEYKRKIEQVSAGLKNFNKLEWVMTINPTQDFVSIKPIFADKYTNNMLFKKSDKVLMMSGTILDKDTFCGNIGIKSSEVEFLSLDSPFPIKNRPVFEVPIGSMGRKSIDTTLPKMIVTIKELLKHHKNEKGIIHCVIFNSNVKMHDNSEKRIIDVKRGDFVKSYNEKINMFDNKRVLNVFNNGYRKCIRLQFDNSELICTEDHLIFTTNRSWVKAIDLTKDDVIISEQSQMKLLNKEEVGYRKVYDLEIEDNHTYIANNIVVHNCHTYKIAKYISDNIKDERLLFHSSDDRIDVLNFHIESKEPTVLVSPSFTEGIDLTGKLSRFQIIAKMPFPYIGDNYVKEKMDRVDNWYNWQTLKTVIQSSGRSIRDYDDWCVTYILDSDFKFLYERNLNLIPEWWKKSLIK